MTIRAAFIGGVAVLACALLQPVAAANHIGSGIAMYGAPKYGADVSHFDYVNPNAPKGGSLRLAASGTFDSFNAFIAKGNPVATGAIETLMTASLDEPFTEYGLLAKTIEWPDDRSWVIFDLNPAARWHDGTPVTADDVVWTFNTLVTKGAPQYRFYFAQVDRVEKLGERRVKFIFKEANNRELPLIVGQLPILPKHYWASRDFTKTTLNAPLGSGPYRVSRFEAGRYVVLERVPDYWGRALPVNVGRNNFDRIRTDYYRDPTAIRLALKAGRIDYREEIQAKAWALDYDVPAVRKGWLRKEELPNQLPAGMQGFVFNTRRSVFADPKVREALTYALDFEWTNRNLFFSQYKRDESYFANSELAATGLPTGAELKILDRFRGRIPNRVFTTPYQAPVTDGSGWPRQNLEQAFRLLDEAGWHVKNMHLVNDHTGLPMRFEILLVQQAFERIVLPFVHNLKRLGIAVTVRLVDQSQYINRVRSYDFDMIVMRWGESESPGNEQREYWGSTAAGQPGSRNLAGIKDPVVDQLIEMIVNANSRAQLISRTRALDRVLLWGFYVVPNWYLAANRILYWDRFSRPAMPVRAGVATARWWYDAAKARALAAAMRQDRSLTRTDPGRRPGWLLTAAAAAALGAVAFLVLRRAWRGRTG